MAKQIRCFIHTGRSRSLCARHKRAVRKLAAKWHIDRETAVFELRDLELAVENARRNRALELEAASRILHASRSSKSKRSRAPNCVRAGGYKLTAWQQDTAADRERRGSENSDRG